MSVVALSVTPSLPHTSLANRSIFGVFRLPYCGLKMIVRGSAPEDTGIFLEGIYVPLIYHFGGLRSVVPADVIETIDFYPGNYSVLYGRAMGGILDGRIKRLRSDQVHGSLDVIPLEYAREWAAALPTARLLVLEGMGHFPYVEAPGRFFAAVDVFVRGGWPE